jgi:hypothetical protein
VPPFIEKPEGFSPEALQLLDDALVKMWLEQVAAGAALSGTPLPPHLRTILAKKALPGRTKRQRVQDAAYNQRPEK